MIRQADSLKAMNAHWRPEHKALQTLLNDKAAEAAEVEIGVAREVAVGAEEEVDRIHRDKKAALGSQVVHLALR